MPASQKTGHDVVIDRTHMGRRASGLERITDTLFSAKTLAPLDVGAVDAPGSRPSMVYRQMLTNPLAALRQSNSTWIFPGYPPSPAFQFFRERTVLYVHDLFLLTRKQDLNWAGRFYMAPSFKRAIRQLRYFFTNSATTQHELALCVADDAHIQPYRPSVENVFQLRNEPQRRAHDTLIVGALGTVEPRKNFLASAAICEALSELLQRPVELHIVGRAGWSSDAERLSAMPHVKLHGFLTDDQARQVLQTFDLFLCTSHAEGLGLPLLEIQYAGIPIVAPDAPIFHEVLGDSGLFIPTDATKRAASIIASVLDDPDWRPRVAAQAHANIQRWNRQADIDHSNVIDFLMTLKGERARCR